MAGRGEELPFRSITTVMCIDLQMGKVGREAIDFLAAPEISLVLCIAMIFLPIPHLTDGNSKKYVIH